jgi:hypothetical protein
MTARQKGIAVLAIQLVLVLSIGVKYAWERHHCPMVWTRAQQWDPSEPIRGRYLAISVYASACGLPASRQTSDFVAVRFGGRIPKPSDLQVWRVVPAVKNGELVPTVVEDTRPGPTQQLVAERGMPCGYARLSGTSDFFVPEHAKSPFPLKDGQELWALVTVPPSGPVRPAKLAISDATGFHVLNLD